MKSFLHEGGLIKLKDGRTEVIQVEGGLLYMKT